MVGFLAPWKILYGEFSIKYSDVKSPRIEESKSTSSIPKDRILKLPNLESMNICCRYSLNNRYEWTKFNNLEMKKVRLNKWKAKQEPHNKESPPNWCFTYMQVAIDSNKSCQPHRVNVVLLPSSFSSATKGIFPSPFFQARQKIYTFHPLINWLLNI